MRIAKKWKEPNAKCFALKTLMNLGSVFDGLVGLLTLGFIAGGTALAISRKLTYERMKAKVQP